MPATLLAQQDEPSETLGDSQQAVFHAALQRVGPSIVRIDTIGGAQPLPQSNLITGPMAAGFRQADGPTTGVIWSADGYIVTSSFNFIRDPTIITVMVADGRRYVATLVARYRLARLAVLKIDASDLSVPALLPRAQLRPGQWALAAGYGHGSERPAVSVGVISALNRMTGRAVQTDAKISPANYGGPLFDVEGRVMGICVPLGPGDDEVAGVQWYDSGVGFAIDTDLIARHLPQLRQGQDLERGVMGVTLEAPTLVVGATSQPATQPSPVAGLRVSSPPRGPAAAAGLKEGDVIVSVDGIAVSNLLDLRRVLTRRVAGDAVRVTYQRAETTATVELTLAREDELTDEPPADPG